MNKKTLAILGITFLSGAVGFGVGWFVRDQRGKMLKRYDYIPPLKDTTSTQNQNAITQAVDAFADVARSTLGAYDRIMTDLRTQGTVS